MACDLTQINPTDKPFRIGDPVDDKCVLRIFNDTFSVGKGLVTSFVANKFRASGTYEKKPDDTWAVSITQIGASQWAAAITIDGVFSDFSRNLKNLKCSSGSQGELEFVSTTSDETITLTRQSRSIEIKPSWTAIALFVAT